MSLPRGTRLGPYEILARLGGGGMGEVYRARDTKLRRDVAVKVLPPGTVVDAERRRRFEREARAASALNHPNVVHVYDVDSADSVLYIAMELVEGRTVRDVLAGGPMPVRKLLDVAVEMADALAKAHEAGIVHRDLKPENVMVSREGHVKIVDFGLAKLMQPPAPEAEDSTTPFRTAKGHVKGTVGYMSPEQAAGEAVDFRSDQFSFGAMLYEMGSGKRAFARATAPETLTAILKEQPERLDGLNPSLPAPLRWMIEDVCLAKDPADRYVSTRDLLRELQRVRAHMADAVPGTSNTAPQWPRRRAAVAAVAAAVAVAAISYLVRALTDEPPAPLPAFQQLTFQRGRIPSARFAPDGQTVLYSASWEGRPLEPFLTLANSAESRPLNIPGSDLLAVSRSGEMLVQLDRRHTGWRHTGTLGQVSLAGGTPRRLLEGVDQADWSPDGRQIAVARDLGGQSRLEYPIGTVLYETAGWVSAPRVSPQGNLVAFLDHPVRGDNRGSVAVVDLAGKKRVLSSGWVNEEGLAWSPSGREVWFTASERASARALHAATLSGAVRQVATAPGMVTLHDISPDGRVLLARDGVRVGILGSTGGEMRVRDLSSQEYSVAADLSPDGKKLLIAEAGGGSGPNYSVYLRDTGGSTTRVLLGEGWPQALSPDGRWVLAVLLSSPTQLVLLPTGAGEVRRLPVTGLEYHLAGAWLPDGQRIACVGTEPGHAARVYVQGIDDGGKARPITPEGVTFPHATRPISPDGSLVAAIGPDGKASLYPVDGGPPRPIRGIEPGEMPLLFSADGRGLYVFRTGELPARVFKLDLATGVRDQGREIAPRDRAGVSGIARVLLTPDGASYVFNYRQSLSELYLVEGLR